MSILPVAQSFNSFIRHADVVKMSNFTALTSLLSDDPPKGTFKTPLFHVFKAFSNNCRGVSIDSYVACDTFNTAQYKGIPYLDVSAVYAAESNSVVINVVNRHKDKSITANITNTAGGFTGKAAASVINAKDLMENFAYDKQDQYLPVNIEVDTKNSQLIYTFPPHSFTQIKILVTRK